MLLFLLHQTAAQVVLMGGNVINVRTGEVEIASVLVQNGIIVEISPSITPPPGANVIDITDRWLIPGLIEIHSHTLDTISLRKALALGVTSVLTIFTGSDSIPPSIEGPSNVPENPIPRIYLVGGRYSAGFPNPNRARNAGMINPSTIEEANRSLDSIRMLGITRIKIWLDDMIEIKGEKHRVPIFNQEIFKTLVHGAQSRGMKVYIHAMSGELYRQAMQLRPTWIIHPMKSDKLTIQDVNRMQAANLGWTTTMSVVLRAGDPRLFAKKAIEDNRLRAVQSTDTYKNYQKISQLVDNPNSGTHPVVVERLEEFLAIIGDNTKFAVANGIVLTVGSDSPVGYGTHIEIEMMRDIGLTELDILKAATLGGAEALGVSELFGTLEVGKVADMVILLSNPLKKITNLRDVEMIMKGGHVWLSSELLSN